MDDNATCHRTLAVQDYLDSEGIQRLGRLKAFSRSKNPIENKFWDAWGGGKVAGRNYQPTNKNTTHPCTHRGMG
ncbi:hypothetical protein TNCV_2145161 [Trichonephila clavipes]|nr:hypothetical protein TNCV_2145161 [Trichonephila clavipes]